MDALHQEGAPMTLFLLPGFLLLVVGPTAPKPGSETLREDTFDGAAVKSSVGRRGKTCLSEAVGTVSSITVVDSRAERQRAQNAALRSARAH